MCAAPVVRFVFSTLETLIQLRNRALNTRLELVVRSTGQLRMVTWCGIHLQFYAECSADHLRFCYTLRRNRTLETKSRPGGKNNPLTNNVASLNRERKSKTTQRTKTLHQMERWNDSSTTRKKLGAVWICGRDRKTEYTKRYHSYSVTNYQDAIKRM